MLSFIKWIKIFVSEQKKNVLEKIKKNIINNSSKKFIFGEDYDYKKMLINLFIKIK